TPEPALARAGLFISCSCDSRSTWSGNGIFCDYDPPWLPPGIGMSVMGQWDLGPRPRNWLRMPVMPRKKQGKGKVKEVAPCRGGGRPFCQRSRLGDGDQTD